MRRYPFSGNIVLLPFSSLPKSKLIALICTNAFTFGIVMVSGLPNSSTGARSMVSKLESTFAAT